MRPDCVMHARHWFTYYGMVSSSAPTCQHAGCNALNPNYDPDHDPFYENDEELREA